MHPASSRLGPRCEFPVLPSVGIQGWKPKKHLGERDMDVGNLVSLVGRCSVLRNKLCVIVSHTRDIDYKNVVSDMIMDSSKYYMGTHLICNARAY